MTAKPNVFSPEPAIRGPLRLSRFLVHLAKGEEIELPDKLVYFISEDGLLCTTIMKGSERGYVADWSLNRTMTYLGSISDEDWAGLSAGWALNDMRKKR
jgi:hypothetical protein